MSDLPIPLYPGETVLKETDAVYPKTTWPGLGYRLVFGRLWLTSGRLVFQGPSLDGPLVFPLSRVVDAAPGERRIRTRGISAEADAFTQTTTLMRVAFDDGGREYFAVKDIAGWADGIALARREAPPLAFTTLPGRRSGVETTTGQVVLWLVGGSLGLCAAGMCCVTLFLFSPAILALMNQGGK